MKYHRIEQICIRIFLVLSTILYFSFMFCDIFLDVSFYSNRMKFLSICLCLLMVVILKLFHKKEKDYLVLVAAFVFTVTADVFLLFTNHFVYGVLSFTIVQLIYLYRIHTIDSSLHSYHFHIRAICSTLVLVVLSLSNFKVDVLLVVVVFYFLNFIGNIRLLCRLLKRRSLLNTRVKIVQFLIGMCLFILCDISVGIYNMSSYLEVQPPMFVILEQIAGLGMWGFYLPGQILIALSTKRD